MGFISCTPKYPVYTFHPKNPALQDSILLFSQLIPDIDELKNLVSEIAYITPSGHLQKFKQSATLICLSYRTLARSFLAGK